jgi:hypothetical protein
MRSRRANKEEYDDASKSAASDLVGHTQGFFQFFLMHPLWPRMNAVFIATEHFVHSEVFRKVWENMVDLRTP